MNPIHQRIAELWLIQKKRELTVAEQDEFIMCLDANTKLAWSIAELENLSLIASMTNDVEWQHSICKKIDGIK